MHPAILAIALGTSLVVQVSDRIPTYHVEKTCQALKEADVGVDQAYKECVTDEKAAQQKLVPIWSSYSASLRARCAGQTSALGMNSYLDLISCLQMTDNGGAKPAPAPSPPTGNQPPH